MSSLLHHRARLMALAAATLLALLCCQTAQAQWTIRANIGGQTHFVKMMDEVGQPHIGYIGRKSGGMIRSVDTGYTWSTVGLNDEVFDIVFRDPVVGYAVGQTYAYKSTDSGKSWFTMASIQGRAIHYIPSTHMIVISCWTNYAQASTDDGATWYACASNEMNGFTALDDDHVMFTPHAGQAKFTSDGGLSWETCNMPWEMYQPAAMKSRRWYIGISEENSSMWRSTDGGFNWEYLSNQYNPTGCIRGNDDNLIMQTMSGMYRSTTQGTSWQFICGPNNLYDTRFWVRGLEIFAMSASGLLYYNPTSIPASTNTKLEITPYPLTLITDGCNIPSGEIKISTTGCQVRLIDTSITGDNEISIDPMTIPADLNSSVIIPIRYDPVGADNDDAVIHLRFDIGGVVIDTFVEVHGMTAPRLDASMSPTSVTLSMSPIDCKLDEASVGIINHGCDAFTIDSFRLSDPVHFQIVGLTAPTTVPSQQGFSFTARSNAVNVKKAAGTLLVYVSNAAGSTILSLELNLKRLGPVLKPMEDKRHIFNTTCDPITSAIPFTNLTCDTIFIDSVKLSNTSLFTLLPMTMPITLVKDESMSIPYEVLPPRPGPASTRVQIFMRSLGSPMEQITYIFANTTIKLVLPADTVKFTANGTCPEFDSSFEITNIFCDPVRIIDLKPAFQPQFTFTLPKLPLELKTNDKAEVGVATNTFFKGVSRTWVLMRYEIYGKTYDTLIYIAVRSQNSFTIDPKLNKVNFGRTSVCAPQKRTVYIPNRYCLPVTIDRLRLSAASSNRYSIIYQPAPARVLAPGEMDSVVLLFAPDAIGARTGAVEVRLKSAVITLDTFFTIEGIGTGSANANINVAALDLGEALSCQHLEQSTVVHNDGCVPMTITGVTQTAGKFDVLSPSIPYTIAPGDSVTLTFELTTSVLGVHDQKVIVRLVSPQNLEELLECRLTAKLTVEPQRFIAVPMYLGKLSGCETFDTTIMVRNPLYCDPIEVTADFTSADATMLGPSTVTIPPGRFTIFSFRVQPNSSGFVGLRLRSTNVDTTIPIDYIFTGGGGGAFTLTGPSKSFMTNACDAVYDTAFVKAGDCNIENITDLRILPVGGAATRFSLEESYNFPIELTPLMKFAIPLRFDPQAQGVNSARLEVVVDGETRTFDLTGDFVPVGMLDAMITSSGMKAVVVGDEFDIDLAVNASLPQAVTINDLTAGLGYDTDLLTLVNVEPQGNWRLINSETESGQSELTFSHPASTLGVNMPLARLTFRTAVAREKSGVIKLEGLVINSGDPRFNDCIAKTIYHESSNDVSVSYLCSGEILRDALNGKLPLRNISVQPHPASSASQSMKVNFDLELDADVQIELINVLGATTSHVDAAALAGHNEIQLPLSGAGKGWHLLRLKTKYGTSGIRVLISD
jgi:photosystem II stability/assembly factor-like uncharacterized protein